MPSHAMPGHAGRLVFELLGHLPENKVSGKPTRLAKLACANMVTAAAAPAAAP